MRRSLFVVLFVLLSAGSAFAQLPPNDTCAGAIEITCGSFQIPTDTTAAFDDYDQGGACTGFNSAGPDLVYVVTMDPGAILNASLQGPPDSAVDGSLYLISNCANPAGSCLVGDDQCLAGENISYTNTGTTTQTLYLIVDAFQGAGCGSPAGTNVLSGTFECPPVPADAASWGEVKGDYEEEEEE